MKSLIERTANRIVRKFNAVNNPAPLEKQIEETARNIIEQVNDIGIIKTVGISLVDQQRTLNETILQSKSIQADTEFFLSLGDRALALNKITPKIRDIFIKVHNAIEAGTRKLHKYETYAHSIKEHKDFKTTMNAFVPLLNKSRAILRQMEK
jgi:hypothetical protein